jgi:hypothetical protein
MKTAAQNAIRCSGGVSPLKMKTAGASHHALLAPDLPPLPQQGEQVRREHGIAIPATLATLDPEQHAFAVNVGHPERRESAMRNRGPRLIEVVV